MRQVSHLVQVKILNITKDNTLTNVHILSHFKTLYNVSLQSEYAQELAMCTLCAELTFTELWQSIIFVWLFFNSETHYHTCKQEIWTRRNMVMCLCCVLVMLVWLCCKMSPYWLYIHWKLSYIITIFYQGCGDKPPLAQYKKLWHICYASST